MLAEGPLHVLTVMQTACLARKINYFIAFLSLVSSNHNETSVFLGIIHLREGRLIPDAFRYFHDLLDIHVQKFQVSHLLCTPGFLLDDALQLWQ